jgi:hypothetical protein
MEDGRWRMEDGEWRMEDGGWRIEDGGWRIGAGRWDVDTPKKQKKCCPKPGQSNEDRPRLSFSSISR